MCGIAGFIDFNLTLQKGDLVNMTDALVHRGPDAAGYEVWQHKACNIGFGHRRLSIIDLSVNGNQPKTKHGLHVCFNGEIYNYKEIRKELVQLGYSFRPGGGDTEVILSAFNEWSVDAVHKFNGMFVIVIYDPAKEMVYFLRDRAGVKPLYYYWKNGLFLFASELKSFHQIKAFDKVLDNESLKLFFQYAYVPAPFCIFKNCAKLKAGHILSFDLNSHTFQEISYWNVFDFVTDKSVNLPEDEVLKKTESILESGFNYRMVADVPVGVFLSGGYDSSIVTALLQKNRTEKLKTFTIGFEDEKFDESPFAKQVADHLGTDHSTYICAINDAKDIIPRLPEIYDEPFADSSAIPTFLVSEIASRHVKVVLSADGGDEQFVGYRRYRKALSLARFVQKSPALINQLAGEVLCVASKNNSVRYKIGEILKGNSVAAIAMIQNQKMLQHQLEELMPGINTRPVVSPNSKSLNALFAVEYRNYMQDDILVKVDRASMANSIESREPFLDNRIAEWCLKLPVDLKFKSHNLKYLIRKITHKYIPEEIMNRPKMGFGIPVEFWLKNDLKDLIWFYIDKNRLQKQGLFNVDFVWKRVQDFMTNQHSKYDIFIWQMLVFQMWYDRWINNKDS